MNPVVSWINKDHKLTHHFLRKIFNFIIIFVTFLIQKTYKESEYSNSELQISETWYNQKMLLGEKEYDNYFYLNIW